MRPDFKDGTRVTKALCEECGTIKAITWVSKRCKFPDTGWWDECAACRCYRYFFRIKRGRVVRLTKI